jgi:hypothetical protein
VLHNNIRHKRLKCIWNDYVNILDCSGKVDLPPRERVLYCANTLRNAPHEFPELLGKPKSRNFYQFVNCKDKGGKIENPAYCNIVEVSTTEYVNVN